MGDPTGQCKAYASYKKPIDHLLIVYAITQKSANKPSAAAFVSEITLGCGCQCSPKQAHPTRVMPIAGLTRQCVVVPNLTGAHTCDFMGGDWCEMRPNTRWEMVGPGPGPCSEVESTVSEAVSPYTPTVEFSDLPEN